jgi:hypothetical protein
MTTSNENTRDTHRFKPSWRDRLLDILVFLGAFAGVAYLVVAGIALRTSLWDHHCRCPESTTVETTMGPTPEWSGHRADGP